jgi:septal ring factor EnvC (AmiA/AmiB activator)
MTRHLPPIWIRADTDTVGAFLLLALLTAQLPTLQQPSPVAPPDGTSDASALVQAAEAAKAQQATKERIAALSREADILKRQSASVVDELRRLDVERALQQAREVQARQSLAVLEGDLAVLGSRQAQLQGVLDRERPAIGARLRRLQRLGRVGYARIAWDARSARDIGRAARLMSYLAKDDGRRLRTYAQTAEALDDTKTRLAARREDARGLQAEARARRTAADLAYQRKQELLASLDQETGQRERWLAELVAARARLDASMTNRASVPPPAPVRRVPFSSRRRQVPWPVNGTIAGRFGRQRDSRFGTSTVSNGITIAAPLGSPVRAVHPGTVVFAGPFAGFGQLVILDHGLQSYSLYGYLSTVGVQRGTTVEAGAPVGDVGDSPEGDAALYLEVRVDGRPVDPLQWLTRP